MIWNQLIERFALSPNKIAVHTEDISLSYTQLMERVLSLSEQLPCLSYQPSRALVQQKDPLSLLIHVLACWSRGYAPVVLRDSMSALQVQELKKWLRPSVVLSDLLPAEGLKGDILINKWQGFAARDEALVICTSGTTGIPKLVALPAESVCLNAIAIGRALELSTDDIVGVNTPLGYMYGLIGGCITGLWHGATCCLLSPSEPPTRLQAEIRRHSISVIQSPPSYLKLFMSYWNGKPFSSVRLLTTGGESISSDLTEKLERAFPQAQKLFLYGMTEAGPRIAHLPFDHGGGVESLIGLPYEHFEWRIDPVQHTIADSNVGRLVLRGPSMFIGYINADGSYEGLGADGYFHSNDLVSRSSCGQLYFRGRIDRIFRSGDKLVNPDAIERVLRLHPAIEDALCFSVPHKILGLALSAEVVFKEGCSAKPSELMRHCAEYGERHTVPRSIEAVSHWAIAESGKLKKTARQS